MKQATQASRALRYPLGVARPIARSVSRWLTVSIFAAVLAVSLHAQTSKVNAGQVQAAYLYNFGKFVKWPAVAPANQSGAFIICVLDQDPFGDTLQSTLSGETVAGKPVAVRRLTKPLDASACHILFISGSRAHELNQILSSIDEAAVLTVSDMPDFSKRGGMIQFVLEGDRIRFEINLAGAEKSHLVFPSELLKVATAVRKPARSGD